MTPLRSDRGPEDIAKVQYNERKKEDAQTIKIVRRRESRARCRHRACASWETGDSASTVRSFSGPSPRLLPSTTLSITLCVPQRQPDRPPPSPYGGIPASEAITKGHLQLQRHRSGGNPPRLPTLLAHSQIAIRTGDPRQVGETTPKHDGRLRL